MPKIVDLKPSEGDKAKALEVLDQLRADFDSGKIVAFVAVCIEKDDGLMSYQGTSQPVSRLRTFGAISWLSYRTRVVGAPEETM